MYDPSTGYIYPIDVHPGRRYLAPDANGDMTVWLATQYEPLAVLRAKDFVKLTSAANPFATTDEHRQREAVTFKLWMQMVDGIPHLWDDSTPIAETRVSA